MNILLGVTGSVAAIKLPKLIFSLRSVGDVKVVATDAALKIISKIDGFQLVGSSLKKEVCTYAARCRLDPFEELLSDKQEWYWERIGDPILHIDLRDWADILVIAPLTANTLAKMAHGLCDNLLTCIYRAWPLNKLIVVAPAMNTDMWEHPVTYEHLGILHRRHDMSRPMMHGSPRIDAENFVIVRPIEKKLACGTTGMGAMASVEVIVSEIVGVKERINAEKR